MGSGIRGAEQVREKKTLTEDRKREMICIPAMSFFPTDTNVGVHMTAKTLLPCKSWLCSEKCEVPFQCEFTVSARGKVLSFKALKKAKRKW